jgi:hypothetical protein
MGRNVVTPIGLDADTHAWVESEAKRRGTSFAAICREAVLDYRRERDETELAGSETVG